MKSKSLLGLAMVVVVLGTVFALSDGSGLQGRFSFGSPLGSAPNFALSSSSPSGAQNVSSSDVVMVVDARAVGGKKTLRKNTRLEVSFLTDSDIDSSAEKSSVILKNGSTVVAEGILIVESADLATAELTVLSSVSIDEGTAETFSLEVNTSDLLEEDAGVDDPLDVTFKHLTRSIKGHTLLY